MNINNKCAWIEWFTVSSIVLQINTGLTESGIAKARNILKQKGLIDFKSNGTKATSYKLISIAKSTEVSAEVSTEVSTETSTEVSAEVSTALNRIEESRKEEEKEEILKNFEILWGIYPNKKGKDKAFISYKNWLKGKKYLGNNRKLSNREMWYAIKIYERELLETKSENYTKYGSTFFNADIYEYSEKYNANRDYWETIWRRKNEQSTTN